MRRGWGWLLVGLAGALLLGACGEEAAREESAEPDTESGHLEAFGEWTAYLSQSEQGGSRTLQRPDDMVRFEMRDDPNTQAFLAEKVLAADTPGEARAAAYLMVMPNETVPPNECMNRDLACDTFNEFFAGAETRDELLWERLLSYTATMCGCELTPEARQALLAEVRRFVESPEESLGYGVARLAFQYLVYGNTDEAEREELMALYDANPELRRLVHHGVDDAGDADQLTWDEIYQAMREGGSSPMRDLATD
jgi:hypothetical protein